MQEKTLNLDEYVTQMALLLELPLDTECQPDVVENFARIMAIAQLVLEFPLPNEAEAAPVFRP